MTTGAIRAISVTEASRGLYFMILGPFSVAPAPGSPGWFTGAAATANATLTLTKGLFIKMMAGTAGIRDTLLSDDLKVDGSKIDLVRFFTLIDKAPGNFAIVTK